MVNIIAERQQSAKVEALREGSLAEKLTSDTW